MHYLEKLDNFEFYHFWDNEFKNALVTCATRNFNERYLNLSRNLRTQNFIFFDEVWILMNSSAYKNFDTELLDFLLQVRKLNLSIFFWYQKYTDFLAKLRKHIDLNIYFKPLLNISLLKPYTWAYRMNYFDFETWKVLTESYIAKDEQWDYIQKERPLDFHYQWMFWKPSRWKIYDDLFINAKIDFKDIWTLWEMYGQNYEVKEQFDFSNVDPKYLTEKILV